MKKYNSYRDSELGWAGQIPSHWEVEKVKYAYHFFTGGTPPTKVNEYFEGNNKWANISDIKGKEIYETGKKLSNEGVEVARILKSPKGSLFYSFKLSVGAVAFCGEEMYTNEAIATFLPGKNSLRFLYYLAPIAIIQNANVNIYGAYILNQELINNAFLVLPPLAEQEAIASYLDAQTARIDSIIEAREKKIKLLEELRAAIISKAVTKGIRKNVEFKDSGIEWIGRIPKHWEKCPLKWLVKRIGSGKTPLGGAEVYTSEGIMFIRSQNVYNEGLLTENIAYIPEIIHRQMLYSEVKHNDILLNITGGSIGRACLIQDGAIKANVNQHVCEIRPIVEKIYPQFLYEQKIQSLYI